MNSREYYDHLDKINQNLMNMKKETIKANRDSILKTNQNNFEIRELPENVGSNYSSVKKESGIREDLVSDQVISKDVLKMADYKDFNNKMVHMSNICVSVKEYLGFDMANEMILDMIGGTKPTMDEAYHDFIMGYKKCFLFPENEPNLVENDKIEGKKYNWNRMKRDVSNLKQNGEVYYETIQKMLTKKMGFDQAKEILLGIDLNQFSDFVMEKYIEKGGSQGELFDSNIKEEKSPRKDEFEFNMGGKGGDVFEKNVKGTESKPTTFALDQEKDAFEGFERKKKDVRIYKNKYIYIYICV